MSLHPQVEQSESLSDSTLSQGARLVDFGISTEDMRDSTIREDARILSSVDTSLVPDLSIDGLPEGTGSSPGSSNKRTDRPNHQNHRDGSNEYLDLSTAGLYSGDGAVTALSNSGSDQNREGGNRDSDGSTKNKISDLDDEVEQSDQEHEENPELVDTGAVADGSEKVLEKAAKKLVEAGLTEEEAGKFLKWISDNMSPAEAVKHIKNIAKGMGVVGAALDAYDVYQGYQEDGAAGAAQAGAQVGAQGAAFVGGTAACGPVCGVAAASIAGIIGKLIENSEEGRANRNGWEKREDGGWYKKDAA